MVNHCTGRGRAARLDRRISFLGQLAPSMTYGGGPGAAVELVGYTLRHLLFTAILLLAMLNELTNVGLVPAVKHTGKGLSLQYIQGLFMVGICNIVIS